MNFLNRVGVGRRPLNKDDGKENALTNTTRARLGQKPGHTEIERMSLTPRMQSMLTSRAHKTVRLSLETARISDLYDRTLKSIKCPYGIDVNDWVEVQMIDLFKELSILCNAISDFCTEQSCPIMRAGRYYEYAWADVGSVEFANPTIVSAPKYMDLLMTWVDTHLNNMGNQSGSISESFETNVKIFCRRLFRVYAHVLCEHYDQTKPIHHQLRYSLYHFLIFMTEFGLLISDTEIEPIRSVIESFAIPNLHFRS